MSDIVRLDDPDAALDRAIHLLREGRIVVVPTDSVYALVADAFSRQGTQRLFGAKRRGRATPLTVLIRSQRQTTGLVEAVNEPAERLMAAYWPGPLTLVFPAVPELSWDLGETRGTVSLRIPTDDFLLDLIAEVGPLAVTSANRRGQTVPPDVATAKRHLGLSAALYVDGGPRSGATSTVVDVTREPALVLREGAVPAADVEAVAAGMTAWGQRPGHPAGVDAPGVDAASPGADAPHEPDGDLQAGAEAEVRAGEREA